MTRRMPACRALLALCATTLFAIPSTTQAQRALTQADFDMWKSIAGTALSPNGQWVAYTLTPQVGDGELVVRATTGTTEHRHPRGFTGRPQLQAGAMGGFNPAAARWSPSGQALAFVIYPSMEASEKARKAKARPADAPKNSLGVFSTQTAQVEVIPRVKSFEFPAEAGNFLFYHLEADSAAARPDSSARQAARPDTTGRSARRAPDPGTTLVIRDLRTGQDTRIEEVSAFAVDDSARWLAYTVTSKDSTRDGAFIRSLGNGTVTTLLAGRGSYAAMTFDRAGRQLAFVSDRADQAADKPKHTLYHAALAGGAVRVQPIATPDSAGAGMIIASGGVGFTRDGSALRFGIGPAPLDSLPADEIAEGAVFDLWHWQDPQLQPQQKLQARQNATRSFAALYHPATRKIARLGSEDMPQVTVSDDGKLALGTSNVPYAIESMWGEGGSDVYLIDGMTGARTKVAERLESGGAQLSPGGRYVVYFQNAQWMSREVTTGRTRNLTEAIRGVRFDQETWDTPSTPPSWGTAGWTTGDQGLVVYDQYDIWDLDPAGARPARMVTDSMGRKHNMRFRVVRTDTEERYLNPATPLLLSAFDNHSKQDGFYTDR
ncbi:MAG: hypothetical protein SGI84_03705, partial [Gemmatimonadota bacterium]|nr:hypothetical protein [Gemmatimonadota bacterium]